MAHAVTSRILMPRIANPPHPAIVHFPIALADLAPAFAIAAPVAGVARE